MKWIPPWLAKAYARIYAEKKTEAFEFSEAARILGIKDERPLAKVLTKLRCFGHLTVRRDPVDPRRKLFKLIAPQSVTIALAIQSKTKTADLPEKLRAASGFLDYYLEGAYAAYQYHRYSALGTVDISVTADQLPAWIALLSEKGVAISIDEIPAEKPAIVNIHLYSDFEKKLSENTRVVDGIRHLSPEALVVIGLTRDRPSLEDVLAILVVQKTKLDWTTLLALCDAYNPTRYLGCLLDVLNFESGKLLFEPSVINKILGKSNLEAKLDFPSRSIAEPVEDRYSAFSLKWNLRLHVSHAVVSKVITDLVRP